MPVLRRFGREAEEVKYTADVRAMIAKLQATLAGSSEGRARQRHAAVEGASSTSQCPLGPGPAGGNPEAGIESGRPSLEPANWHARYRAMLRGAMRKELARKARRRRKAWLEDEAAREDRRRGRTFGEAPAGVDPFAGFRGEGK